MPTVDREGLGPAETRALADELMTYANQLLRAETQAGMGGKDLAVRVKEPGELASLMVRAASALQARGYAAALAEVARLSAEVEALRVALKPFADAAAAYVHSRDDSQINARPAWAGKDYVEARLLAGHLCAARTALAAGQDKEGGKP